MRRMLIALGSAAALVVTMALPALGHELEVRHPHSGDVIKTQWVGGDTVPEPAQDAPPMFGPFSLPPSHGAGLPNACESNNSPAVAFLAPPFGSCQHGVPLGG